MKVTGVATALKGTVKVPGDKSISHRSIILGSLAEGQTTVEGFLTGEDCLGTIECFKQMGVKIKRNKNSVQIDGVGLHGLKKPDDVLYVGNSGTTIRIMSGVLAAQSFISVIDGDASIRRRPMQRIIDPLTTMGGLIFAQAGGKAPLIFKPSKTGILGGSYSIAIASAQIKSALLLAGLYAKDVVTVKEPTLSRNHTECMLQDFGVKVEYSPEKGTTLPVKRKLKGCHVNVPGDISSAAFVLAAAAIVPDSHITVKNVGLNPTRTGIIDVLEAMGADITVNITSKGAEPSGDITVKYRQLKGTNIICGDIIPRLVDEIPVLAVLAATAKGKTIIKDAGELRVKEADRLDLMVKALKAFGVKVLESDDGMEIVGSENLFKPTTGLDTAGDHRLAMAYAVAGLHAEGETHFTDDKCIEVSFPQFTQLFNKLGANMVEGA